MLAILLFLSTVLGNTILAQIPDTTQTVPPDTSRATVARPDSTQQKPALPPLGFLQAEPGTAIGDTILALSPESEAVGVLATLPASFFYDFGTPGWPNGWSPFGLNPQRIALLLDGRPFDDPVTGRPRYDLLPVAFLEPMALQAGRLGAPIAVHAMMRAFDTPRPLTELTYRTSNTGLQSVMGLHTQQRRRRLFGHDGILGVLFGYGGHAADGEYPNSDLRKMRQVLVRIRYQQSGWSVELTEFRNLHRLGAHGGVQPQPGLPFESIYTRIGASVRNPDATRKTSRNDLALTTRVRLATALPGPLTASAYWTTQTFRYRNPGTDTLITNTDRFGARVHQDFRLSTHRLRLLFEGWTDQMRHSDHPALPDTALRARSQAHVSLRDTLHLGRLTLVAEGGFHATEGSSFPSGTVSLSRQTERHRFFADIWHAGQPISWIEQAGFGRYAHPVATIPNGRVSQGRLGLTLRGGNFDLTLFGFAHMATQPLDLYATATEDSVVALATTDPIHRAGAGGDLGWRRDERPGLYLTLQPTIIRVLNPDTTPEHERLKESVPSFFARGVLGARYALFNGDLDLDLSLRGRFWTAFRSRILHAPTGLLTLPLATARPVEASGTLDIVVQADIRTATLFIAYENLLSGTQLLVGNQIVPVYPLPERHLRFGVYWPIPN